MAAAGREIFAGNFQMSLKDLNCSSTKVISAATAVVLREKEDNSHTMMASEYTLIDHDLKAKDSHNTFAAYNDSEVFKISSKSRVTLLQGVEDDESMTHQISSSWNPESTCNNSNIENGNYKTRSIM